LIKIASFNGSILTFFYISHPYKKRIFQINYLNSKLMKKLITFKLSCRVKHFSFISKSCATVILEKVLFCVVLVQGLSSAKAYSARSFFHRV
jgi:hypothetical protein